MEMERTKKRINIFMDKDMALHIVTENDSWFNGYVIKTYDDYFDFLDREDGLVQIYYCDIRRLDFFKGELSSLKRPEERNDTTN